MLQAEEYENIVGKIIVSAQYIPQASAGDAFYFFLT